MARHENKFLSSRTSGIKQSGRFDKTRRPQNRHPQVRVTARPLDQRTNHLPAGEPACGDRTLKQRAAGQEKPGEQNAFPGGDESVCHQSSFLIPHSSTATATVANNRRQQKPAEASIPPSGEADGEINPNVAAESVALGRMSLK